MGGKWLVHLDIFNTNVKPGQSPQAGMHINYDVYMYIMSYEYTQCNVYLELYMQLTLYAHGKVTSSQPTCKDIARSEGILK